MRSIPGSVSFDQPELQSTAVCLSVSLSVCLLPFSNRILRVPRVYPYPTRRPLFPSSKTERCPTIPTACGMISTLNSAFLFPFHHCQSPLPVLKHPSGFPSVISSRTHSLTYTIQRLPCTLLATTLALCPLWQPNRDPFAQAFGKSIWHPALGFQGHGALHVPKLLLLFRDR